MTGVLTRISDRLDWIVSRLAVVLMILLVVDVTWQVATRYLMQNPSSFTEELAAFLLIWLGLLGGAYAYRQKSHLGVDFLTRKMTGTTRTRAEIFTYIVAMVFAILVLLIGGIRLVYMTLVLEQVSAALQVPMGYIYCVLPLSGLLIVTYSLTFIVETLGKRDTMLK